ncbi:hypothetical protein ATANTOWER_020977 [Ataeniobius toweri]|uniref:Uncharacterized protein n=1 Tax=Ataeniobius toweri TaxID=208326 RepID=A0ABU7CIC7_9TELE|nr:hypothetical protein [Ataeniobius toweri]
MACTYPGHINQTIIGPCVVCHGVIGAVITRPGPVPAEMPVAMPAVNQQCRLEARSGPDLFASWELIEECMFIRYRLTSQSEQKDFTLFDKRQLTDNALKCQYVGTWETQY